MAGLYEVSSRIVSSSRQCNAHCPESRIHGRSEHRPPDTPWPDSRPSASRKRRRWNAERLSAPQALRQRRLTFETKASYKEVLHSTAVQQQTQPHNPRSFPLSEDPDIKFNIGEGKNPRSMWSHQRPTFPAFLEWFGSPSVRLAQASPATPGPGEKMKKYELGWVDGGSAQPRNAQYQRHPPTFFSPQPAHVTGILGRGANLFVEALCGSSGLSAPQMQLCQKERAEKKQKRERKKKFEITTNSSYPSLTSIPGIILNGENLHSNMDTQSLKYHGRRKGEEGVRNASVPLFRFSAPDKHDDSEWVAGSDR